MPFSPPYISKFNAGDLIYGLKHIRDNYVNNCAQFAIAKYNDSIVPVIDKYAITADEKNDQKNSTQPVARYQKDFTDTLLVHPKYKSACETEFYCFMQDGFNYALGDPSNMARKCKGGLYWASMKQKFQVHFLLDGINFEEVILKSNFEDRDYKTITGYVKAQAMSIGGKAIYEKYPDRTIRSKAITGSELRWIYRNKNDYKVQQTIQFWWKGRPCSPPWMNAFDKECTKPISELWLRYVPKSEELAFKANDLSQDLSLTLAKLFNCDLEGL